MDEAPPAVTGNRRAFRVLVRNALFRRVELAALRRWDELGELDAGAPAGTPRPGRRRWSRTSPSTARSAPGRTPAGRRLLILKEGPREWAARQIFDDPAGDHDWGFSATIDLAACDEAGEAVLTVTEVGQL